MNIFMPGLIRIALAIGTGAAMAMGLFSTLRCSPSPYLLNKHAVYNFTDQGFLTPDLLQTRGGASLPRHADIREARRICLERALHRAVRRALCVLLHTHFDIGVEGSVRPNAVEGGFATDYPHPFTERDYIRAEIDFGPILRKGFIALQDLRSAQECTIVFRIMDSDLPGQIRGLKLTFTPEKLYAKPSKERSSIGTRDSLSRNDSWDKRENARKRD